MGHVEQTTLDFGVKPDRRNKRNLRAYQVAAVEAIERELTTSKSTLVVMATGLGKSVVLGELAARTAGNVLVLSHRNELVRQVREHLWDASGEWTAIEQGLLQAGEARLVSASVQTMVRRLKNFERDWFELIVIDEAHHATASTYRKIIDHFSARIVGVTATPDRGDGTGLRGIFQTVAYEMGIVQGVAEGWLVPLKGQRRFIEGIHLEKIKKVAGDLALGALDNEIVNSKVAIARDLVAQLQGKHAIVFTPGVESAKLVSAALNEIIPGCSREVDGNTNEDERRESFDLFKAGSINYLVNCAIATEGVDLPVADVIAMCRPTLSRALYTQMVGRGLRSRAGDLETFCLPDERRLAIARSCKPDCLILDYVGNSGKHDLIGPEDILGADESDAVRKEAKKIVKERSEGGEQIDIQEAIRLAKKALAELADRRIEAKVRSHGFDPLAAFSVIGRKRPDMDQRVEPPTAAQLAALLRFKLKESELKGLTKRSAGALMDKLIERSRLGLCSAGQMRALMKFTDVPQADLANVSFPLASAMIDRIARSNWKRGWTRDELFPKDDFVF
jgi:superfamily II DNA or RNA helicase